MIIAIDFDGTIVEHAFPKIGKLKNGVQSFLYQIIKKHQIIIWSCRNNMVLNCDNKKWLKQMEYFLEANNLPYTRIDLGDRGKIVADVYIDDRAINFNDNWKELKEMEIFK